jgi:hypothetical protein
MRNRLSAAIFSIGILFLAAASSPKAELPRMGLPIPTTIIVTKPAPGEIYGDKPTVTMGVGDKVYKFILKDGYTNHLKVRWPDIWQYVMQFNPNFVVQGQDAETFAKIQPGQTVKVSGAFAPLDRTFEVLTVEQSGGDEQHY